VLGKIAHKNAGQNTTCIPKPYHYRDLLHKIDEVLAARTAS
jgi:hypothetical protein